MCKSLANCKSDEKYYLDFLNELQFEQHTFHLINKELENLNLIGYRKFEDYSVFFIRGGALGEFNGYLINSGENAVPDSFTLTPSLAVTTY